MNSVYAAYSVVQEQRLSKVSIFLKLEGIIEKSSNERLVYELVDDMTLSLYISQKSTENRIYATKGCKRSVFGAEQKGEGFLGLTARVKADDGVHAAVI